MEISQAVASASGNPPSPPPTPSHDAVAEDLPSFTSLLAEGQKGSSLEAAASSSSSSVRNYDEDEDDVCRICRNPGDSDNPLRYPCASSGSIKFVHQDFLLQWLDHSNGRQCEEFVVGMGMKAFNIVQFFLHLSFVLLVWRFIIPYIIFWIQRLAFVRSFSEAHRLFLIHLCTTDILTDCPYGFLLSASIVFIFLGATSLRDYFRHLREVGVQDAERNDDEEINGARAAARWPTGPPNRNVVDEGIGDDGHGA